MLAIERLSNITISRESLEKFCKRWQVTELALFGSVLRDDFHDGSDVDVLVSFAAVARPTLFDLVEMEAELVKLFQRKVDLLTRKGVENSRNYLRRDAILSSARVVYESRSPIST